MVALVAVDDGELHGLEADSFEGYLLADIAPLADLPYLHYNAVAVARAAKYTASIAATMPSMLTSQIKFYLAPYWRRADQ